MSSYYRHVSTILSKTRSLIPPKLKKELLLRDWLSCAVSSVSIILNSNIEWMVLGEFVTQYAAKRMGQNLSPFSLEAAHDSSVIVDKQFKLLVLTDRPYTPEVFSECMTELFTESHPGFLGVTSGENDHTITLTFDNGLGPVEVIVRFITHTTPVFDIDLLALKLYGWDVYDYTHTIPLLLGKAVSQYTAMMYKPIIIERLIENICTGTVNIVAVPQPSDDNVRQRRWISRRLAKMQATTTDILNLPFWEVETSDEDETCVVCREGFTKETPANRFCVNCSCFAHESCMLEYISSRLETYTFITCFTCRQEIPLRRPIIMDVEDLTWDGCFTDSDNTDSSDTDTDATCDDTAEQLTIVTDV